MDIIWILKKRTQMIIFQTKDDILVSPQRHHLNVNATLKKYYVYSYTALDHEKESK